ncbi:hypothetical protein CFIO01_10969 [Colletotrichum fioriniae PJ7]|uniref:Uncharacterized protein n=1 Tax=Colletotrichum fioriniae PJ7 TaxID=1445577 RepID=A0A010RPY5_9PEZI|nr:hypothetical protein CFIO01_10969 [Colletotrichum fioriniae PJ7]
MMLLNVSGMWDGQSTARPGHRAGLEHTTGTLAGRGSTQLLLLCSVHERQCRQKLPPRPGLLHLQDVPSSLRWHPSQHALAPSFHHGAAIPRKSSANSFQRRAKFLFNQTRPGSFPSLVPRAEADLRSRRPAPPGRFFVSVRITNIFCSKGMLRPATVSYVRFPMHQEMDIKICTARDQRRLPYVWRPGTEGHQVDDTSSCDIRYGYNALVHCHRADYVAKPDLSCPLDRL